MPVVTIARQLGSYGNEIARALAARAPLLGEERAARIVHAIITESLDAATE